MFATITPEFIHNWIGEVCLKCAWKCQPNASSAMTDYKKKKKKKKSFSIINYTASPLLWGARWMDWELKRSHARICCIFGGGSEMWRRCTLAPTCVTDVQVRCATNKRLSCKMWCSQAWMEITQQSGIEKGNRAMTMWFQHAQKKKRSFLTTFTHEKTRGASGTVTSYLQQMWRTRCRTAARTRTKPEELSG